MTGGPIELASTVVSVGISTEGLGKAILKDAKGVGAAFGKVGRDGGNAFSQAFSKSSAGAAKPAVADQEKLAAAVQSATGKVKTARDAEAAAARKVAIEEAKLKELRDAGAKGSQILAVEDRLANARTKQALATARTTTEVDKLKDAQRELKSASEQAEQGVTKSAGRLRAAFDKINPFAGMKAKAKKEGEDAGDEFGSSMERSAKKGQGRLSKAGVAIGTAVGGGLLQVANRVGGAFVDSITGSISGASNLEQSIGGIGAVFGADVGRIDKAAREAATSIGMSRNAYNELATTVGAGLKNKGIQDYAGETQRLLSLGGDLAAQFGGSTQEAVEALSSLMRGEADPIERYGVSINETAVNAELAARGQDKLTGAALESAKAQARLDLVFRQTADAQGAFARESNTFAGVQARAAAQWEDLQAKIGTAFLPILTKAMGFVGSTAIPALDALGKGVQGVWSILSAGDFKGADFTFGLSEDSPVVDILFRIHEGFQRLRDAMTPLAAAGRDLWATFQPLIADLAKLALGTVVLAWEALTRAVASLTPILAAVAGWIRDNGVLVRSLAVAVIGGVAAFKAYELIILAVAKAKVVWAAAQKALNVVLKANPIGLLVTALGALVAGLVYAYQHSETFRNVVNAAWSGIKAVVGGVVDWFTQTVVPFFVGLWDKIAGGDGPSVFQRAWGGIKDFFAGLWSAITAGIQSFIDFAVGLFMRFHPAGIIISHWGQIVGFFQGIWASVVAVFSGVVGWLTSTFGPAFGVVARLIALPVELGQKMIAATAILIMRGLQALADWAGSVFAAAWRLVETYLVQPVVAALSRLKPVWDAIVAGFAWLGEKVSAGVAWLAGNVVAGWKVLSDGVTAIVNAVVSWVVDRWTWWSDRLLAIGAALWSGIKRGWEILRDGTIAIVGSLVQQVTDRWTGFADRIVAGATWIKDRVVEGFNNLKTGAESLFGQMVAGIGAIWDRLKAVAAAPVRFVIDTVINNGIIKGWNDLIGLLKLPGDLKVAPISVPGFWRGGVLPGPGTSAGDDMVVMDRHGVPRATVASGEPVISREAYARNKPIIDNIIRGGSGLPAFFQGGTLPTPGPVRPHGLPYYGARYAADMGLGTGSPVYAWRDGTISQVMYANTSYGNRIRANHGDAGQTLYAHLSRILVGVGQAVRAGQKIGEVGYSGNVRPPGPAGAHLHFEILGGNAPISASATGSAEGDSGGLLDMAGQWITDKVTAPVRALLDKIPGAGLFLDLAKAVGSKLLDAALGKLKGLIPGIGNDDSVSGSMATSGWQSNANLLMQAGKALGASRQAMKIALMTAAQESSLGTNRRAMSSINSDGDVGWFQQRATRGDGTVAQLADPLYGLRVFLQGKRVPAGYHVPGLYNKNWQSMGLGQAAQAVQVSAFPRAYDKWADEAEAWLNNFGYWRGTNSATPGWHLVGERGPELVNFRGGEQVLSNSDSAAALAGQFPSELVVVDADGALVGRMRVEAESALADSYARVGGR